MAYLNNQKVTEEEIAHKIKGNTYTLEDPLVLLNPYGLSPLSALLVFNTEDEAKVSLKIYGKDLYTTFEHEFNDYKTEHKVPVYALYADKENRVLVTTTSRDNEVQTNTITIKTEPLPNDFTHVKIEELQKEFVAPGLTFIMGNKGLPVFENEDGPLDGPAYSQAFDMNGDTRWYLTDKRIGAIGAFIKLRNGNMCVGSEKNEAGTYYKQSAYEMNLLGQIFHEYTVSGMHHDFEELPSGNIIALCREPESAGEEDYIVEFDRETAEIVREWDLKNIYTVENQAAPNYLDFKGNPETVDWIHANAVIYDESDNTFVISGRNQDAIFKFEIDSGELKWIATQPEERFSDHINSKLLKPVNKDHTWHIGQHHIQKIGANDYIFFDNMSFYTKNDADDVDKSNKSSAAVIFRVDEKNMTIEELWRSDEEIGNQNYSSVMGSVEYLGDQHVLVNYSSVNRNSEGDVDYDYLAFVDSPYQNATMVEYFFDKVVFKATYDGNYGNIYRANRSLPYWSDSEL